MKNSLKSVFNSFIISEKLYTFRWSFPFLFLLITAVNFISLNEPPFWDDLIGVQTQAVFLARHHLSLRALLDAPEGSASPCYYLLSLLSWFYALLYTCFQPWIVHLTGHLLNCACLAGCGTLFLKMSYGRIRTIWLYPALLFALTHPVLAGRGAAMGQEAALAFIVMLSLYYWSKNAKYTALFWALFSLTIKLTGLILPAAFSASLFFSFLKDKKKNLLPFAAAAAGGLAALILYKVHFADTAVHFAWKPEEIRSLFCNAYYLLIPEFLLSAFLLFRQRENADPEWYAFFWCILAFYAANFFSAKAALPRYGAIIVFPTVQLLMAALAYYRIPRMGLFLLAGILFNLGCLSGMLLPQIPVMAKHDGSLLERSYEFTGLRQHYRDFCAEIAKAPRSMPLVVTWPVLQMLTVPEFGYVDAPVKNIVAGEYLHPLGNFRKIDREMLKKPLLILYEPNCYNWKIPQGAVLRYASNPERPVEDFIIYQLK